MILSFSQRYLHNQRLVSYVVSEHNDNALAIKIFGRATKAILAASHHCSTAIIVLQNKANILEAAGMTQSICRIAHRIDSPMAGLWGHLKRGILVAIYQPACGSM